jgi:hypothetical protein
MTHPLFERKHLEALLVARTLLDPTFADDVDETRLSQSANALLDYIDYSPILARNALDAGAADEYQLQLAKRAKQLTAEELAYFEPQTLVALVNKLPAIGARRVA